LKHNFHTFVARGTDKKNKGLVLSVAGKARQNVLWK
jgi:hypothetical protein